MLPLMYQATINSKKGGGNQLWLDAPKQMILKYTARMKMLDMTLAT
jgi:hypothetical protein